MEENNFDITAYILKILSSNLIVIWSWGFECPKRLCNGLSFKVNGFKIKGEVQVVYNSGSDLFDISFYDSDEKMQKIVEDIYLDQLVDVIDEHVERVPGYAEIVDKFYRFKDLSNDEK